jgi:hypothetical protein
MIKLKEILLKESTYVKGKLNVLLKHAKNYLFDEGDIGKLTFWSKWTKQAFINNVTKSSSVEDTDAKVKFSKEIDKAFNTMRKDVEKAYNKWEKSVEKATKPFDKEYTGV